MDNQTLILIIVLSVTTNILLIFRWYISVTKARVRRELLQSAVDILHLLTTLPREKSTLELIGLSTTLAADDERLRPVTDILYLLKHDELPAWVGLMLMRAVSRGKTQTRRGMIAGMAIAELEARNILPSKK